MKYDPIDHHSLTENQLLMRHHQPVLVNHILEAREAGKSLQINTLRQPGKILVEIGQRRISWLPIVDNSTIVRFEL